MIPVVMLPHSDRSGREKKKKPKLPTALTRRRAMAASHVFFGIPITLVPRWGYSSEVDPPRGTSGSWLLPLLESDRKLDNDLMGEHWY